MLSAYGSRFAVTRQHAGLWGLEVAEALAMRTAVEPASRSEADALLRDRARRLVRAHVATREDQDFAQSQKSMIEQTMREYGGRFL